MRLTTKGQVTIPQSIRRKLSITPYADVEFIEEGDKVYLVKKSSAEKPSHRFRHLRGAATVKMSTDEIMALTRGK